MLSIPPSDLCTDQEFIRRAYLDVCGVLPTPKEVKDVPRRQVIEQARQADRRLAGAARIRRLLDAQMVGRVPQQSQERSRSRARTFSSTGCASHIVKNNGFDAVVQRAADGQRQHLRQPAGQLLPHRPRSAEPGRDDGAAVLRHPHAVRQVPQPPVRALDAGRLLQHGRVLRPRPPEEGPAGAGRQPADAGRRRSSSTTAPAR